MLAPPQGAQGARRPRSDRAGKLVALGDRRHGDRVSARLGGDHLGRGAPNDIPLDDDFASTRHARVEPRRDGVWIEDVGSTNGTSVNGVTLTGPRKLVPGDVVRVGRTDLRFER